MDRKDLEKALTESDLIEVSASTHIMASFREDLKRHGFIKSTTLRWKPHGSMIKTAGRVIIIHTPPTKSKKRVMFLTLEDEDGLFDLTVFEDAGAHYAKKILASSVLLVQGVLNRFGLRGVSVVAKRFWTLKEFYKRISNDEVKALSPGASGRSSPVRDKNTSEDQLHERIKHEQDTCGHRIMDRQDLDQKRHLLPEASNYRGRPS